MGRILSIVLVLAVLLGTLPLHSFATIVQASEVREATSTGLEHAASPSLAGGGWLQGGVTLSVPTPPSPPTIIEFTPTSGKPGTEVTVTGTNFATDYPNDNAVDFFNVPAEVISVTATQIKVKVPSGAATGPISVRTPGGRAVSKRNFTATFSRSIDVRLPAGLNAQNFMVVNKYGSSTINSPASVPANPRGVTLHSAVPNDPLSRQLFFYVDALQAVPGLTVTMDAMSTAQALVFLHPQFLTPRAERAQIVLQTMSDDLKVAVLAQVIETVFPGASDPLTNNLVITALREAAQSVMNRLPADYVQNFATILQPEPDPGGSAQPGVSSAVAGLLHSVLSPPASGEPLPVFLKQQDLYMMKASIEEPGKLSIGLAGDYNPVDWLVQMRELDPKQNAFAQGMQSVRYLPTFPGDVTVNDMNQPFTPLNTIRQRTVVTAESVYDNIDIVGQAIEWLDNRTLTGQVESGVVDALEENILPFDINRDAVYELRMINPVLIWMWGTTDTEWEFLAQNYPNEALFAHVLNIITTMVDGLDILLDVEEVISEEMAVKLVVEAGKLITLEFPDGFANITAADFALRMGKVALLVAVMAYEETRGMYAQKFAQQTLLQRVLGVAEEDAEVLLNFFGKAATIASMAEKTAYIASGRGSGYSMSPIESAVLVVGDPFSPKITGFSPVEGAAGDVITISGQRFSSAPASNTVRFGEAAGLVKTAAETLLTVEVPADATPGDVTISLQTPAGLGESQATFRVLRKPVISGLSPTRGFVPKANFPVTGQNFPGSLVVIEGSGFDPTSDMITFGGWPATNIKQDESSATRLAIYVPISAVTGPVEIITPQGRKGSGPQFTVLGAPVIQPPKDFEGPIGMVLTVPVANLSGAEDEVVVKLAQGASQLNPIFSIGDGTESVTVGIPSGIGQGTINITTPAGTDSATFKARLELGKTIHGTLKPNTLQDDMGNDPNSLSLREAVAVAAGLYALWDDEDDAVEIHFNQIKVSDGVYTFAQTTQEPPPPQPGPGKGHPGSEKRTITKIYHLHSDNGGGTETQEEIKYLDSGEYLAEEADMFTPASGTYTPGVQSTEVIKLQLPQPQQTEAYVLTLPGSLKPSQYDEIEGDQATTVNKDIIDATALADLAAGLGLFELSLGNVIKGVEIKNPPGGITILMGAGAHDSQVLSSTISGARGVGIQIGPGAYENSVKATTLVGMKGSGILITGGSAKRNVIENNSVGGVLGGAGVATINGSQTGWGIEISAGASHNVVTGGWVVGNKQGGVLITGQGSDHNLIEGLGVGLIPATPPPNSAGNLGDGIRIAGGAKYNLVGRPMSMSPNTIAFNQGDGLSITGVGTSGNAAGFAALQIGIYFQWSGGNLQELDVGNLGNGIRISDGASGNRIDNFLSRHSGGYALLIEGQGTDRNMVLHGTLGGKSPSAGGALKGLGGIAIRNGPKGNDLAHGEIGGTTGDAILISNAGDAQLPNKVGKFTIGAMPVWNPNIGAEEEVPWPDGRSGIRLEGGAHHNILDMNRVNHEPTGLDITGAGTSYNRFRFNRIKSNPGIGISIDAGADSNSIESTLVSGSGQEGIILDNVDNTSLLTVLVRNSGKDGTVIRNGSDRTMIAAQTPAPKFITTECPAMPESPIDVAWPEVSSSGSHGIVVNSASQNTIIRNAAVFSNKGDGVQVKGLNTSGVEITRSYIGVSLSKQGTPTPAGNTGHGIQVTGGASGVILGGVKPAEGNLISANTGWGVWLQDSSTIRIFNNLIGTDATGSLGWGNAGGVALAPASVVVIGAPGMGNVVSGNLGDGLNLNGTGTSQVDVVANHIGVNRAGNGAVENQGDGIEIANGASRVLVGNESPYMRNIISGNKFNGINVRDAATANIRVAGNYIGTDAKGKAALSNRAQGVALSQGVKRVSIGAGNIISGNNLSGALVEGTGTNQNQIVANRIGLSSEGLPLGNLSGVYVDNGASLNRVNENTIWNNAAFGVAVNGNSTGNAITGNSISKNGDKGIALMTGGNNQIPAPRITSSSSGLIQGEVDASIPERSPVEVFADDVDEGLIPVGTAYVNRGRFVLRAPVPAGYKLTAIVTDAQGNTSEFGGKKAPLVPFLINALPAPEAIPDNVRIVFTSTEGGNKDIYLMDGPTGQANALTTASAADYRPQLSPDGSKVVFVSERDNNQEIYTIDANGYGLTRLTSNSAADYDPAWSPDGSKIVFVSERDGDPEIYVMEANGNNPTKLHNTAIDRYPVWSPDGTRIAFTSHRDGNGEIYVIQANGTGVKRLTNDPAADYQPGWLSNGSRLVFLSERDSKPEVYAINSDGSGTTRLTNNLANEGRPVSLPGTDWVAFHANLNGEPEVYAMTLDGLNTRRITVRLGVNDEPSWVLTGGSFTLTAPSATNNSRPAFGWSAAASFLATVDHYEVRMDGGAWSNVGNVTNYTWPTALAEGSHTISLKVIDKTGDTISTQSAVFMVDFSFMLQLKAGWNLISLPVQPSVNTPSVLLPDVIQLYEWNADQKSYAVPTQLVPGKGYWALVFSDVTQIISGTPVSQYQLNGVAGWHLTGSLSVDGKIVVNSGTVWDQFYGWDATSKSYQLGSTLIPGKGYWVLGFTPFTASAVAKP